MPRFAKIVQTLRDAAWVAWGLLGFLLLLGFRFETPSAALKALETSMTRMQGEHVYMYSELDTLKHRITDREKREEQDHLLLCRIPPNNRDTACIEVLRKAGGSQ